MSSSQIIVEQYKKLPVLASASTCGGKTYIVTGGNTGIGLETARHLVNFQAARVIISSRNVSAGEKAKADIERTTGRKGVVEVWQLDLASHASTKAFARKAASELERIDALIQNAGVMVDKFELAEGHELSMTVNVISTMLLAVMLMPKLIETAQKYSIKPRIVFVSSALAFQAGKEMAKGGRTDIFKNLNDAKRADMAQRYPLTKTVQLYAVREFAKQFPPEKTGVIINMTAPGICSTGLARDTSAFTRATIGMVRAMFARTPEEGSRTTLHGIIADEESHGKFLSGCKIKDWWAPAWVTDENGQHTQKQVYKELVGILEQVEPGCVSKLK